MITRITINLEREERAALMQLAERERRDPRSQAAWLIRQQLEQLGLLPLAPVGSESVSEMGIADGRR